MSDDDLRAMFAEISRRFDETDERVSHADLDRRIRTLEDAIGDLQARVERLEATTH